MRSSRSSISQSFSSRQYCKNPIEQIAERSRLLAREFISEIRLRDPVEAHSGVLDERVQPELLYHKAPYDCLSVSSTDGATG